MRKTRTRAGPTEYAISLVKWYQEKEKKIIAKQKKSTQKIKKSTVSKGRSKNNSKVSKAKPEDEMAQTVTLELNKRVLRS